MRCKVQRCSHRQPGTLRRQVRTSLAHLYRASPPSLLPGPALRTQPQPCSPWHAHIHAGEALLDETNPNVVRADPPLEPSTSDNAGSDSTASRSKTRIWPKSVIERHKSEGYSYVGQLVLLSYSQLQNPRTENSVPVPDTDTPGPSTTSQPGATGNTHRSWSQWVLDSLGLGAGTARTQAQGNDAEASSSKGAEQQSARTFEATLRERPLLPPEVARLARTPQPPQPLTVLRVTRDGYAYVRTLPPVNGSPRAKRKQPQQQTPSNPSARNLLADQVSDTDSSNSNQQTDGQTGMNTPDHVARMLVQHLQTKKAQKGLDASEAYSLALLLRQAPAGLDMDTTVDLNLDGLTALDDSQTCLGDADSMSGVSVNLTVSDETERLGGLGGARQSRRRLGVFSPDQRISCPR